MISYDTGACKTLYEWFTDAIHNVVCAAGAAGGGPAGGEWWAWQKTAGELFTHIGPCMVERMHSCEKLDNCPALGPQQRQVASIVINMAGCLEASWLGKERRTKGTERGGKGRNGRTGKDRRHTVGQEKHTACPWQYMRAGLVVPPTLDECRPIVLRGQGQGPRPLAPRQLRQQATQARHDGTKGGPISWILCPALPAGGRHRRHRQAPRWACQIYEQTR